MPRLAVLLATSGHSGVDRVMQNLLPAMAQAGIYVDLLHIEGHGPYLHNTDARLRVIELGVKHVNTALPSVIRYLRQEQPDVLLSDKDRVNRMAILARGFAKGSIRHYVRIGTTVSANLAKRNWRERAIQRFSMRYLYPYAAGILVPSQGVLDDLHMFTGSARPMIHVVPSPIIRPELLQLAAQEIEDTWLHASDAPLILGIGELSMRKDYAMLIRAFARLRQHKPLRLAILGKGRERDKLLQLAQRYGIKQDVYLPGFVQNPYAWLRHASLFAHSSRWEGLCIALIEALALGKPVVATDCPSGSRELLADGANGILVPVGDDKAMANAINEALIREPQTATWQAAVASYNVEQATSAYLQAMDIHLSGDS